MSSADVTIEILKAIRDGVNETNTRIDQTNARIDQTNARLESMHTELSRRIVESEVRTATAITELAGTVREMTAELRAANTLRPRLERCEGEVAELRDRVDRIERTH